MRTFGCLFVLAVLWVQQLTGAPLTAANQTWNTRSNWTGHVYRPSKTDWRSSVCFQLMTDRFFDGCPTNNELAYGGYDVKDRSLRHGGDFEGVRRKTDYLKGLGVDMIWISPVFQNKWNDYHGYGQIDRTLFDKRWGTLTDFRNMADALHQNDLYLCVDEVSNHGGNLLYGDNMPHSWPAFKMHSDEYELSYYTNTETHLDYTVTKTYSPEGTYGSNYDTSGNQVFDSGSGGYFLDDFHHNGDCSFDSSWQQWLGEFPGVGYDDFATERESCIASHLDGFKALMSQDIDAIREDTPMEMLVYYFQKWCPAARDFGRDSLAKSNFFMFGEYFTSFDYAKKMTGKNANGVDFCLNSGVDYRSYFDFFRPAIADQNNGSLGKLKSTYDAYINYDFSDWADNQRKYTMLTFFNNHDQPRLSTWNDGDAKTRLASGIVLTWPGIPSLYHGDEQGFKTAFDGDKNVREDYMVSAAYVTDGGVTNRARVNNFNMCHENYKWIAKIANYRRLYPALWQTDELYERWHQNNNDNGVYAFTRVWGAPSDYVLVVFNTWASELDYAHNGDMFTGWAENDVIVNLMNTAETKTLGPNGKMPASKCVGYGLQIWVRNSNVRKLAPIVETVAPAHDAWVAATTPVVLTFSKAMDMGALTSAFRINGQPVAPSTLALVGGTVLTYTPATAFSDGINFVGIMTNACDSTDQLRMFAAFSARFRVGSTTNPVVNYDLASDATLINNGGGYSNMQVTLTHKATGAEWFRCSNDGTTWGAWTAYTNVSTWTLSGMGGTRRVWAQYWADGSAAAIIYADANESRNLQASFSASPLFGAAPLTVYFTNTSTTGSAAIVSFQWNFGDSTTATTAHPVHTYADYGEYTVQLVVYDGFTTATNTKQRYISVAYRATNAWDDMESSVYSGGIIGNNGGSGFGAWQAGNLTDGGSFWGGTEIAGAHCLGVWANAADVGKQYSLRRGLARALTNETTVSVKVRGSANLWNWTEARISFVLRNGNSADHWVDQRLTLYFAYNGSAGKLYWYDGSDHEASVTYTQNHIYNFVITLNPASNTYAFTVTDDNDSNNTDTRSGTLTGTTGAPIDSFAIYEKLGTSEHDVHWDNFCVVAYSNPLQAAFSAVPTNGPAPLAVQFTDASSGNPTSWSWDFDNNGSSESSAQNPTHTFPTAGVYAVKLVVSNGAAFATTIKTGCIIIGAPNTPDAPSALTCTAFVHRIDLAWSKNASNDAVVLVRNASGTFDAPANGTWYSPGQACAGGTVIYQGAATWASDTNRPPGGVHYYKAWSVNTATNYSLSGATAHATTLPFDAPSALTIVSHIDALDLAWMTNSAGTGVMLVRNTSGTFNDPVDGTTYTVGSSALGGTIVYQGRNLSLTDAGLAYNTDYHYKLWSRDDEGGGNYPYYSAAAASASMTTGAGLPIFTNLTFAAAADADLYATALSGGVWYVDSGAYWWTNGAAPAAGARVLAAGVCNPDYSAVEVALDVQAWAAQPYQRAGIIARYHLGAGGTQEYYTLTITNAPAIQLVMARWQGTTESNLAASANAGMAFDPTAVYRLVLTLNEGTYQGSLLTGSVVICQVSGTDSTIAAGKVGVYAGYGSGAQFGGFSTQIPEPALLVWSVLLAGMAARRRAY